MVRHERRQIALDVDDNLGVPLRIDPAERLETAVGAGGLIVPRPPRPAAGFFHSLHDRGRIGGDHHGTKLGRLRPAQNVHDHRLSGDFGERLARQPGRGHAGGNENKNLSHRFQRTGIVLIRVARTAANRLIVRRLPYAGSHSAMNSFEINKILGALLGTCLVLVATHIASGAIFAPETPAKPGYLIEVKAEQPAGGAAAAAPAATPIATLLASASTERGAN